MFQGLKGSFRVFRVWGFWGLGLLGFRFRVFWLFVFSKVLQGLASFFDMGFHVYFAWAVLGFVPLR